MRIKNVILTSPLKLVHNHYVTFIFEHVLNLNTNAKNKMVVKMLFHPYFLKITILPPIFNLRIKKKNLC